MDRKLPTVTVECPVQHMAASLWTVGAAMALLLKLLSEYVFANTA